MASVVDSDRFRTLKVTAKSSIKDFVTKHRLLFKPGRGFYQLTKAETIQIYKEVVARRKSDGSYISGNAVRKVLGIPNDSKGKFKLDTSKLPDFDIFIQSTSYNRVLVAGTEFLYEVDDSAGLSRADIAHAREAAKVSLADGDDETSWSPSAKKGKGGKKSTDTFVPPAPPGGPGSPIEIVFSFDTTGSMWSCLEEVRKRVQEVIERLTSDIPGIKIAVLAHGDYCDRHNYITDWVDFTGDRKALCGFVKNVKSTGGGDWEECYELVLHQVRTRLSWSGGTQRSLVMIGDAIPHPSNDSQNYLKLDWKEEADKLAHQLGVRVYAVQCQPGGYWGDRATPFYSELAKRTGGRHLNLEQFSTIIDFILAICYREQGMEMLKAYEAEVKKREMKKTPSGMNKELNALFEALKTPDTSVPATVAVATPPPAAAAAASPSPASALKRKKTAPAAAAAAPKKAKKATGASKPAVKRKAPSVGPSGGKKPRTTTKAGASAVKKPRATSVTKAAAASAKKPRATGAKKSPAAKVTKARAASAKKPIGTKKGGTKKAVAKKPVAKKAASAKKTPKKKVVVKPKTKKATAGKSPKKATKKKVVKKTVVKKKTTQVKKTLTKVTKSKTKTAQSKAKPKKATQKKVVKVKTPAQKAKASPKKKAKTATTKKSPAKKKTPPKKSTSAKKTAKKTPGRKPATKKTATKKSASAKGKKKPATAKKPAAKKASPKRTAKTTSAKKKGPAKISKATASKSKTAAKVAKPAVKKATKATKTGKKK